MISMESVDTVKEVVRTTAVLNHLKNNRLEYLMTIGILHLLGVSDLFLTKMSGVCF
jgi:hypothetical protein